ncbi:hypothetical protein [Microseira wollei]|uniref:Uncharacterized protein n=1 Tax=Microseira wollei NIES-4236 TaxID=2530354 RepID=A0AAV3XAH6_9CYAN|nr:hypothetical protein [Microseira wollei]GET37695.1 hypothetical protein MiSe_24490 [Microseira wollei NIES-4236]
MQSNLQKLYITPEDLKAIAAVSQRDLKAYEQLKYPRLALLVTIGGYVERILLLGWGLIPLGYLIKWKWLRKRQKSLFEEVDKYNTVIKAIEINDQLVAAGNKSASLTDREKLISTLETTRENLMCALKTERILRENRAFIARNQELLASNLAAVQALQVSYEAREYTKLLNEALEAAQAVQGEMKRLESGESDL